MAWATSEAHDAVARFTEGGKRKVHTEFPVSKIYDRLCKDALRPKMEKPDYAVAIYLTAVLDYITADSIKLIGNYVKMCNEEVITVAEIRTATHGDLALATLFQAVKSLPEGFLRHGELNLTYGEAIRLMMDAEAKYLKVLDIITKVFVDTFEGRGDVFPPELIPENGFAAIKGVVEVTQGLHSLLEDSLALQASRDDLEYPPVGSCFYSVVLDGEFTIYWDYIDCVAAMATAIQEITADLRAQRYLQSAQLDIAVTHELPKLLLEPVYHVCHYLELLNMLCRVAPPSESAESAKLAQALSALGSVQTKVQQTKLEGFEHRNSFLKLEHASSWASCKVLKYQENIGDWSGPNLSEDASLLLVSADLCIWNEKLKKLSLRTVFVFDTWLVLCKVASDKKEYEYRLKSRMDTRCVKVETEISLSVLGKFEKDAVGCRGIRVIPGGSVEADPIILLVPNSLNFIEWKAALLRPTTYANLQQTLLQREAEYERTLPSLMPSVSEYIFAEPDSPTNIRFEPVSCVKSEYISVKTTNQEIYPANIKGGTLTKLVERLTHPRHVDLSYLRHFLITFRSFCTPHDLLGLLQQRYKIQDTSNADPAKVRLFARKIVGPIKLRVVHVFRHWIDHHYEDFRTDVSLLKALLEFVKSHVASESAMKSASVQLTKSIRKQREHVDQTLLNANVVGAPDVLCLEVDYTQESVHPMNLHPVELARQLTLIESELYRAVRPAELSGLAWTKPGKETAATNVLRLIYRSNLVTNWVIRSVLEIKNIVERTECISLFLDVLRELRALQNFNGVMEIVSGLQHTSVSRLKLSWVDVHPKRRKVLDECSELMSSDRSFSNLRDALKMTEGPTIPFFGMYLSDLTFIEQGSPDFLSEHTGSDSLDKCANLSKLINFGKQRLFGKTIVEIQQYQSQKYCFLVDSMFRRYLLDFPGCENSIVLPGAGDAKEKTEQFQDVVYCLSNKLEPRGVTSKTDLSPSPLEYGLSAKVRRDTLTWMLKRATAAAKRRNNNSRVPERSNSGSTTRADSSTSMRTDSLDSQGDSFVNFRTMSSGSRRHKSVDGLQRSRRSTLDEDAPRSGGDDAVRLNVVNPDADVESDAPPLVPRRSSIEASTEEPPPRPPRRVISGQTNA